MTLLPSPHTDNEFILEGGNIRERSLALALGARVVRGRMPSRMFLNAEQTAHWRLLVDAGYWPVRRRGQLGFWRDPRPVALCDALDVARELVVGVGT